MTGAIENIRLLRQLSCSPFLQRAEESPSLQAIVLFMGWWVAVSLAWVGAPAWIWLGGALLLTAGHAFSWIFRAYKSPIRAGIVSIALVGTLALVPDAVSRAISGDWLPLAYFLVLFQGVASFEMRTRGGLYASIIISGAIFFFVSQQALDITFIIFLTGYTTLLLSFLALSFLLDQVRNADVRWFQNRFSFTLFWTGVFVASMLVSAAIFLLLPKHFIDPINNAQGAILPMRASDSISLPEVTFDQAAGGALPVTAASQDEQVAITPTDAGAATSIGDAQGGEGSQAEFDAQVGDSGPEMGVAINELGGTAAQPVQETIVPAEPLEASISGSDDTEFPDQFENDPLIMQVRSPVLTYWRERAYDVFDGNRWHSDRTAWFRQSSNSARDVYTSPQPRSVRRGHLYNQTFFVMQPQSSRRFLSGYAPLVASIPVAEDGSRDLEAGSVYRIISSLPDYSLENLRTADPSSRLEFRYHQVPSPDKEEIELLARQITAGAFTDVDRMRRIITYIDRNYAYDTSANNQLELTTAPVEFLREQEAGTSMDIATATVLLARASGIPARLVTGYLPGRFDPLSGTYMVRASDSHAWAEVFFSESGWVPFDSAPRPATAAFGEGGTFFNSSPVSALFSTDYSEDIYGNIRSSPELITDLLQGDIGQNVAKVIGPLILAASVVLAVLAAWKFAPSLRHQGDRLQYSRLAGDGRSETIHIYQSAEKLLQRAGISTRTPSQTLLEHSKETEAKLGERTPELEWLRKAAWVAAYDPSPFNARVPEEARAYLDRLKAMVKSRERELRKKSSRDSLRQPGEKY